MPQKLDPVHVRHIEVAQQKSWFILRFIENSERLHTIVGREHISSPAFLKMPFGDRAQDRIVINDENMIEDMAFFTNDPGPLSAILLNQHDVIARGRSKFNFGRNRDVTITVIGVQDEVRPREHVELPRYDDRVSRRVEQRFICVDREAPPWQVKRSNQ
jgi:hypothetical protein